MIKNVNNLEVQVGIDSYRGCFTYSYALHGNAILKTFDEENKEKVENKEDQKKIEKTKP